MGICAWRLSIIFQYWRIRIVVVLLDDNRSIHQAVKYHYLTEQEKYSLWRMWQPTDPSGCHNSLQLKKNIRYYDTAVLVDNLLEWRICISSIKCINGGKRRTMLDSKIKCSATYLQCKLIEETLTPICVFIRHIGNIAFLRNSAVWY